MKSFILFALLSISQLSFGQQIKGKVVDGEGEAIEFANIALYTADTAFLAGTVTDTLGLFELNNVNGQAGFIKVSCVGYIPKDVPVSQLKSYNITLQQDNVMLGEVVVKSRLPKYTRVQGGYSITIKNSILEKLYNAEDVLSSLPRVNGGNGSYTVFGKGTPDIYVNNRKLRDLSELKHLKPTDIDKVTILTNPGVKYDSEVRAVIIIKTRRKQGEGLSGNVDGTYDQKDKAGYDADMNLNWRSGKLDVFGSWEQSNVYNSNKQEVEQAIQGNNHVIHEDMSGMHHALRHKDLVVSLGADYWLNDSNSIGVSYRLSRDLGSQYMRSWYFDKLYIDSTLQDDINYRMLATPDNGPSNEIDGYYNGNIKDFKIVFDATYYQSKQRLNTSTSEISPSGNLNVTSDKKSSSKFFAAKLIASTDVAENLSVDFGMEYNVSDFNQFYHNREGIIESKANKIKENNIAGLFSVDYDIHNFNLSAGIRYEHTSNNKYENGIKVNDVSRSYNRIYPNIDISYAGEDFNMGLSYSVTSEKPSYGDLSSVVAYNSKYFYEGGNPNLDMTVEHCLELSASYRDLSFLFSYEIDKNSITRWGRLYNDTEDIILLTNINIPTVKLLYFSLSAEPSIAFWHPLLEFDIQKQFIDNRGLGQDFNKPIAQVVFNNRFIFNRTMFGINYLFRTSGADGYTLTKKYQRFDAFVAQTFLHGSLQVKLQLEDIFKSSKNTNEMYSTNYNIKQITFPSFRTISLSVSYNFNKTHKRYLGTGAGSSEKNRL